MATVLGIAGIRLSKEECKRVVAGVTTGIAKACGFDEEKVSVNIIPIAEEGHSPSMDDRITYFVYTHAGKSKDEKQRLIKAIYDATIAVTGYRSPYRVVTFIKEHVFSDMGLDDTLLTEAEEKGLNTFLAEDAKRRQSQ